MVTIENLPQKLVDERIYLGRFSFGFDSAHDFLISSHTLRIAGVPVFGLYDQSGGIYRLDRSNLREISGNDTGSHMGSESPGIHGLIEETPINEVYTHLNNQHAIVSAPLPHKTGEIGELVGQRNSERAIKESKETAKSKWGDHPFYTTTDNGVILLPSSPAQSKLVSGEIYQKGGDIWLELRVGMGVNDPSLFTTEDRRLPKGNKTRQTNLYGHLKIPVLAEQTFVVKAGDKIIGESVVNPLLEEQKKVAEILAEIKTRGFVVDDYSTRFLRTHTVKIPIEDSKTNFHNLSLEGNRGSIGGFDPVILFRVQYTFYR